MLSGTNEDTVPTVGPWHLVKIAHIAPDQHNKEQLTHTSLWRGMRLPYPVAAHGEWYSRLCGECGSAKSGTLPDKAISLRELAEAEPMGLLRERLIELAGQYDVLAASLAHSPLGG